MSEAEKAAEELVHAVMDGFERGPYFSGWPADEIALFRDYDAWDSFTDRESKLQRLRARKVIALVAERAAQIAESKHDDEPDGYYGQACFEVAAAIRKELGA